MILTFPWPDPVLWPNRKVHWSKKAKARAKQKSDAYYITLDTWVNALQAPQLRLTFHPPDRRRRDLDGALSACKGLIDGIALAWKIDDSKFGLAIGWGEVTKGGKVVVTYD